MYLGLDLGTSGLKGLIVDEQQKVIAFATTAIEVSRDTAGWSDGWSEQDPAEWIAACRRIFSKLKEHLPAVRGIGIAGHMHGVVLVEKGRGVVRPCILWNDIRATEQAAKLDAVPAFRQLSGTMVFPGFSAPKMLWVQDEEPNRWAKADRVLFPKDYLAFWLTGELACEPSDAAGSALFDCEKGEWSQILCDAAGLSRKLLPPIVPSSGRRGKVLKKIAQEFAFDLDCIVAGGAGDNAAASIGIGAVNNGEGQVSLGTSGVLLTVNERWTPDAHSAVHSFNHAVDGCFIQMGVTLTASDSLSWFASLVGKKPEDLASALPKHSDGPGDLLFLPYLAGERTPHNLSYAMGGMFGLSRNHGIQEMTQAVMEGVAYSLADCGQALENAGAFVDKLTAVGGGTQSQFWLQTLADVLGKPLTLNPHSVHAAALGGAKLAMAAAREQCIKEIVSATPGTGAYTVIQPRPELFDAYHRAVCKYRDLFKMLRNI